DREVMNAERLFSTARELRDVAAGRAVLRQAGLAGGDSPARFIAPGRKYPQPAINRLWGWGIIAQFAYYLAGFPWYEGNILFAFAVAAQVLTWCETRSGWRTAAAILLMALWGPLSGSSYGIAGLLMLAVSHRLYRAEDRTERLALVACLLAVIPALNLAASDAAAVAGLVMTVLTVGLVSCAGKSLPRFWPGDFFPVFYACHLAVLGVLAP
ncbi:TPA: type-F conjugative transfer system pilin acetylase TraX, partial [Escherichia coli]